MKGELIDFESWDTGKVRGFDNVFGLGNVLTGKGNIKDSRKNAAEVSGRVVADYLFGGGDEACAQIARDGSPVRRARGERGAAAAQAGAAQVEKVYERVRRTGSARVTRQLRWLAAQPRGSALLASAGAAPHGARDTLLRQRVTRARPRTRRSSRAEDALDALRSLVERAWSGVTRR